MSHPLLIPLQQQSQQFQTESTRLIKLVEQLLVEVEANIHSLVQSAPESDNAPLLESLLSHTPLLSQIKTLNDEQSKRLGDLQTVLNECITDMNISNREHEITKRELELAKTENSILKQQHKMSMQFANPFNSFPNSTDQFALVGDFNQYDIVEGDAPNNHTLSPALHHNNIKSLAISVNNYKDRNIARLNSSMGRLVRTTIKKLQVQSTQLRINEDKLDKREEEITQLRIDQDKLRTSEQEIKQRQTTVNKREQAIIKNEKIVKSRMGGQLKPIMKCISHNMKTWDDAWKDAISLTEVEFRVLWKITNLKKQLFVSYYVFDRRQPLLSSLYKTGTLLPILGSFFNRDYKSGKIPKLTDNLKLYFSAPHVMGGKWIQFHGPGSCFQKNGCPSGTVGRDGNNNDIVLSHFSLCDFNKKKPVKSTTDLDRCDLAPDECKKRHKSTDNNYLFYHSSPTERYSSDFVINIKWD